MVQPLIAFIALPEDQSSVLAPISDCSKISGSPSSKISQKYLMAATHTHKPNNELISK